MPSGPKKRMKLRRKKTQKEGSPADASSDTKTEGLSISESMDVLELDNDDVDTSSPVTPGDHRAGRAFDNKDAISSQTEEWVRVSDFDVGTPTSQTGENEPALEDTDTSNIRRSLDKLGEWESLSGDSIVKRDGSINSLEEEPSEVEVDEGAPSRHSSEGFTHLLLPQPSQENDLDDMDRRSDRSDSSSTSTSSSGNSDAHSKPRSGEVTDSTGFGLDSKRDKSFQHSYADVLNRGNNGHPEEKGVFHEGCESSSPLDTSASGEREMEINEAAKSEETESRVADVREDEGKGEEATSVDAAVEDKPVSSTSGFEQPEADETVDRNLSATNSFEEREIIVSDDAKDFNEDVSDEIPVTDEALEDDKKDLHMKEDPTIPADDKHLSGDEEKTLHETTRSDESSSGLDSSVKSQQAEIPMLDVSEGEGKYEKGASENLAGEENSGFATSGVEPVEAVERADGIDVETISAASPVEEKEINKSHAKDISEIATPLDITVPADHKHLPEDDEKIWLEATRSGENLSSSSILDIVEDFREDKEVASSSDHKHEETKSVSAPEVSAPATEDKQDASSSAETEEAKKISADVSSFESNTTIHERKSCSGNYTELTLDSVSMKPVAPSRSETERQAVVEERHATADTTQPAAAKREMVTGNLRPHSEQKSLSGCCGVIYWLLGREY